MKMALKYSKWNISATATGSLLYFKLKLMGTNQKKHCSKYRRPPMEDDLKNIKSGISQMMGSMDHSHILNLSSGDQNKVCKHFK